MAFRFLNQELAMDLGTANTVIFQNDQIVLDEPIERQVWVKDFKSTTYTGLNKKGEE